MPSKTLTPMPADSRFRKPARKATAEDRKQTELLQAATTGLIRALKLHLLADNPDRLVRTLQPAEAERIAGDVLAAAALKRAALELNDDIPDFGRA